MHEDMLFYRGECVTHMKIHEFQENSGDLGVIYELGQNNLLYTYGAIVQAWYILWDQHV